MLYYKKYKRKTTIGCLYFTAWLETTHEEEGKEQVPRSKSCMGHVACIFKSWTIIFTGGIPARSRRNRYSLQLIVSETLLQRKEKQPREADAELDD